MKTLKLGHSGIDVSRLCLGILPFGTKVDRDTSFALLDAYYETGGRFIDTANNYSKWHAGGTGTESETVLGEWLEERGRASGSGRDELVIATKVGFNRDDRGPSLSKATIDEEAAGSHERLGIERIDLYYAHTDIRSDPLQETLAAFNALVRGGKARAVGCSNYRTWRIAEARAVNRTEGFAEYCCVQQRHTYLRPRPGASFSPQLSSDEELLDYCREYPELRMLAYSPLLNGAYTRADREIRPQYLGAETDDRLLVLREVASELGATPNQVIYAWMLAGTPAVIPLTAPTSMEQLEENLAAVDVNLSVGQMERLTNAGNP